MVTIQPTDNPDTKEDESQGEPTTVPVVATKTRKKDCYTFLVMGMDDGNGNTDTIMAVTFDVKGKHVSVISIPRDTLVDVPRTIKKINAYSTGGIEEVQKEVSGILGFPVDHYITVNLRGFKALVDAVGGVDFEVPINMNYDDPTQNLHIHLSKGMQHLDGEKALQLVRFRLRQRGHWPHRDSAEVFKGAGEEADILGQRHQDQPICGYLCEKCEDRLGCGELGLFRSGGTGSGYVYRHFHEHPAGQWIGDI